MNLYIKDAMQIVFYVSRSKKMDVGVRRRASAKSNPVRPDLRTKSDVTKNVTKNVTFGNKKRPEYRSTCS